MQKGIIRVHNILIKIFEENMMKNENEKKLSIESF